MQGVRPSCSSDGTHSAAFWGAQFLTRGEDNSVSAINFELRGKRERSWVFTFSVRYYNREYFLLVFLTFVIQPSVVLLSNPLSRRTSLVAIHNRRDRHPRDIPA